MLNRAPIHVAGQLVWEPSAGNRQSCAPKAGERPSGAVQTALPAPYLIGRMGQIVDGRFEESARYRARAISKDKIVIGRGVIPDETRVKRRKWVQVVDDTNFLFVGSETDGACRCVEEGMANVLLIIREDTKLDLGHVPAAAGAPGVVGDSAIGIREIKRNIGSCGLRADPGGRFAARRPV